MQHYMSLYHKPKLGTGFIRSYPVYGYKHRILATGGFDTAGCNLGLSQPDGEAFLRQYLGNRVAFFATNPVEPIWEGLISRIKVQVGSVTFTVSLDNLFNRTKVTYSNPASTTVPQQTAVADDADSQAIYGIKEGSIEAYAMDVGSAVATHKTTLRDMLLSFSSWPRISTVIGASGGKGINIECVGFYHTLKWESYTSTVGGTSQPNTLIASNMLPNLANGTTFFDNADTSLIVSNAAYTMSPNERQGKTFWQKIQEAAEPGDGTSQWVAGVTPTDPNTGKRVVYYNQANTAIEYTARLADGLRIRNLYGRVLPPWDIRPDRGIRLLDAMLGWGDEGDDPREAYIESIDYDANSQRVRFASSDNIAAEGAFQLTRFFKLNGTPFGPPPRQTWS